ncbi:MAG: ABC transporter permease [Anaerolineae bacterium]|nr:ABC transporter permease [Anaerolineae bacterium]
MAAVENNVIRSQERVKKLQGVALFWAVVWARAYPRIIGALRQKSWLFFETVFPLLGVVGYIYVYRAVNAPQEYIGFVVLGGAMTAFWLNVLWSMASQLYWDKEDGNLEIYVLCPAPMMAILVGMAIGGMIMSATRAVVIIVVCSLAFGVVYSVGSIPTLIAVFLLTMIALYGMGMMFASVFLASGREAWHIANLLQEPIYLVSGFYFPVRALGTFVAAAASLVPLTMGMDGMRQLLFPSNQATGLMPVELEVVLLILLSVLFIGGAYFALRKLEQIGRREGRLIERRR